MSSPLATERTTSSSIETEILSWTPSLLRFQKLGTGTLTGNQKEYIRKTLIQIECQYSAYFGDEAAAEQIFNDLEAKIDRPLNAADYRPILQLFLSRLFDYRTPDDPTPYEEFLPELFEGLSNKSDFMQMVESLDAYRPVLIEFACYIKLIPMMITADDSVSTRLDLLTIVARYCDANPEVDPADLSKPLNSFAKFRWKKINNNGFPICSPSPKTRGRQSFGKSSN